jgi:hypothetical protein
VAPAATVAWTLVSGDRPAGQNAIDTRDKGGGLPVKKVGEPLSPSCCFFGRHTEARTRQTVPPPSFGYECLPLHVW